MSNYPNPWAMCLKENAILKVKSKKHKKSFCDQKNITFLDAPQFFRNLWISSAEIYAVPKLRIF